MAAVKEFNNEIATTRVGRAVPVFSTQHVSRGSNYALLSLFLDITGTLASILIAAAIMAGTASTGVHIGVAALTMIVWGATFLGMSVYDVKDLTLNEEVRRVTLAVGLALLILMGLLYAMNMVVTRETLTLHAIINIVTLVGWRSAVYIHMQHATTRASARSRRVLLISGGKETTRAAEILRRASGSRVTIAGILDDNRSGSLGDIPVWGNLDADLFELVNQQDIDEIVVALPNNLHGRFGSLLDQLMTLSIPVYVVPDRMNLSLYHPDVSRVGELPLVKLHNSPLSIYERMAKRSFDIAAALAAIIAFSPIMLIVALAIRLESKGPILFKQNRVGEGGRSFKMYKFRSMVPDADKMLDAMLKRDENGNVLNYKDANDPRVTRVGRIIRKTSLDELPQFFNVLFGDMSLVGPRPELPKLVAEYQPWQRQRFSVPQGITGWWQVNGRSDKPCHLNTDQDLYYIDNYSFLLDIKILLRTVPAVVKGKGAF